MTDISTDNLTYLLNQATPGPWVFVEDIADSLSGTQEIGHVVYAQGNELGDCLFGIWDDPVTDNYPTNLPLAARGPELAQEVIRLRDHIEGLITAMEEKVATGQSVSPETIAGYLKDIILKETG